MPFGSDECEKRSLQVRRPVKAQPNYEALTGSNHDHVIDHMLHLIGSGVPCPTIYTSYVHIVRRPAVTGMIRFIMSSADNVT